MSFERHKEWRYVNGVRRLKLRLQQRFQFHGTVMSVYEGMRHLLMQEIENYISRI
jgi:hypothetical protein